MNAAHDEPSPADRAAGQPDLARLRDRIAAHVAAHGTRYSFATYADATTGEVVVTTDAPRELVDALLGADARSDRVVVRSARTDDV